MSSSENLSIEGELVEVPFATVSLEKVAAKEYRQLLGDGDPEEVLVLTGSPTSMGVFRDSLRDEVSGAGVPLVTSTVVHATEVIDRVDDRGVLSDQMRRELVHRFIEDKEWETEYLRKASKKPSFNDHVASLMETVAWQDVSPSETPELAEISGSVDGFHEFLSENGYMERSQLVPEAVSLIEEDNSLADFDGVLAVEFEEFYPVDRRYLDALVDGDTELVCITQADSAVRRTSMETGEITDHVSFTDRRAVVGDTPSDRPSATATYLSSRTAHEDPVEGEVTVLEADTADEQVEDVSDEIERLMDREGWSYDDFAVVVKNSGDDVADVVEGLRQAGLPTRSSTVTGFGEDPAVRELLEVVRCLADDDRRAEIVESSPVIDEETLSVVEEVEGFADKLRAWATESGLKQRIADGTPSLDARARFGNVTVAFRIAEFVEDTEVIDTNWIELEAVLKRAYEYAPQKNETTAMELGEEEGVRVDHVQSVKNGSFRAVFLLDAVDSEYPGNPSTTPLFPDERVADMPDYPGVTCVSEEDVRDTFGTNSTESIRSFSKYYSEHARRLLAVGADAASERLYFCLYSHEDKSLENRVQASRFLSELYARLSWISETEDPVIRSEREAEEYILSRIDNVLNDVRRANSQDVEVSLEETKGELVEIQRLLDASGERGDELRDALRARVDFIEGRVRRD